LVYDNIINVVRARRQAIADADSKDNKVLPEKKP